MNEIVTTRNQDLTTKEPVGFASRLKKRFLLGRRRYLCKRDWCRRYQEVFARHPEYRVACAPSLESEHQALWRPLRRDMSMSTLRVCAHISGISDARTVPEEVFVSEIEACLNRYDALHFLTNKSIYDRWFQHAAPPETLLHNIDSEFYDGDYQLLADADIEGMLDGMEFPVVMKPSIDSGGGRDVCFPDSKAALEARMQNNMNYVIQRKLVQHEILAGLNTRDALGVNTFRVCLYRSVLSNQWHVLNIALRMGCSGTLDNDADGGISCALSEGGRLNAYAVDKYGNKYASHPDSGVVFAEYEAIPHWDGLRDFSRTVAREVYLARLIGLDVCLDAEGKWRLVEINVSGQSIRFAQYAGQPFFGSFTQEVVDYCRANRQRKD